MSTLRDITLVSASVSESATFGEAAAALAGSRLGAIAVLAEEDEVVGLFTDDDLIQGVFPRYLRELKHTAFLVADPPALVERVHAVRDEPVREHMRAAETLELDTSATHAAELFLHREETALPVVDGGRFVGMLPQTELCVAVLRRLTES